MGRHSRRRTRKNPSGSDHTAHKREPATTREPRNRPVVSTPTMAAELAELRRLVLQYPDHARQLVVGLPPPVRSLPARYR